MFELDSNDCPKNYTEYWNIIFVADISGTGVSIGFISTAYILLIIVCIYYVVTYDVTLDQYRGSENHSEKSLRPNPYDRLMLRTIRKCLFIPSPEKRRYHVSVGLQEAFNKCVRTMADIQIFTGLAIMISGYVSLGQLSALHWKMIVYLAWFSCSTHLSALIFLRNYLINRPAERLWRLLSMFILVLALVIAMVPTGHFYWDGKFFEGCLIWDSTIDAPPAAKAIDYFNTKFSETTGKNSMLLSVILLVVGFAIRLVKLHRSLFGFNFESISRFMIRKVLNSAEFFQMMFGSSTLEERVVSNMIVAACFVVCIYIDVFSSMASDVYWIIVSLIWGTLKLLNLHDLLKLSINRQYEDAWSFGQVLPVVLIAAPLISLLDHFLKSILSEKSFQSLNLVENDSQGCNDLAVELGDMDNNQFTTHIFENDTSDSPDATREYNPSKWILKPQLLDRYYEENLWVSWTLSLFNAQTAAFTILSMVPVFSEWNGQSKTSTMLDTAGFARIYFLWVLVIQGATTHISILLGSLLEEECKNRVVFHFTMFLLEGVALAGTISMFVLCPLTDMGDGFKYGYPFFIILGSFGLFIITLIIGKISSYIRIGRR